MAESLKDKTVKGVIWSSVERFSVQGVQFFVMLVIARLLTPNDYGLVGMLAIFIAVAQTLIDSGFSQALIRKQNRTETDNNTVFYFNIVVSILLYVFLFAIAPSVADFYEEPQLVILMRVLCIVVIINSFAVVQRTLLTANINFKLQAKVSFISALVSGSIGVCLALKGFGVWTLVFQQLLSSFVTVFLLWWFSPWRPDLLYSWKSFRELFSFGSKLMAVGLIDTIYNNLYQIIIGKIFSAASLGFYTRAQHFSELPSSNITGILQRVTYPVLCNIQDDNERLRDNYRKLLRVSAFVVFPVMCLMAGLAHPLVQLLIGDKWDYAATLLIPICFFMMWYPIHAINLNLLQVKGRSDLFLKLEIIKKVIIVSVLILSIPFGLLFMCYSRIATTIICLVINTYYTGKLIQVGFIKQMKDILGSLVTSFVVFLSILFVVGLTENPFLQLLLGFIVAVTIYLGTAFLFKFEEIKYIKQIIRK